MVTATALAARFTKMKTLPNIAIQLTRMISQDTCSISEFEDIIKLDPTLALKLLKMVNSPYYALISKVTRISEAVAFIGMNNLRNLIVMDVLKHIVKSGKDNHAFSRNKLWLHSAAVGILSQMIVERIFGRNGEDAFLCGLIHDIGMIVEDQMEPLLFMAACNAYEPGEKAIVDYEKECIGTDHTQLGFYLARDWKLPLCVRDGIGQHHQELESFNPDSVAGVIQIADYLVYRQGISPIEGMQGRLSQVLVLHMRDNIQEYKNIMADLPHELTKAKELYSLE